MVVTIMRGVPGSGKSTFVAKAAPEGAVICSADDYFISPEGEYKFDGSAIKAAHEYCWGKFQGAISNRVPSVFIDNTNVKRWEFERYVVAAEAAGYEVSIVVIETDATAAELAARNKHGVPEHVIQRKLDEFEL